MNNLTWIVLIIMATIIILNSARILKNLREKENEETNTEYKWFPYFLYYDFIPLIIVSVGCVICNYFHLIDKCTSILIVFGVCLYNCINSFKLCFKINITVNKDEKNEKGNINS